MGTYGDYLENMESTLFVEMNRGFYRTYMGGSFILFSKGMKSITFNAFGFISLEGAFERNAIF